MWDIVGILSTPSRSSSTTSTRLSTTACQDLSAPQRSHSAYPLWTWHWHDREHGCAGCCILMYYPAERGARFAWRHIFPLYPCCTSRRRGVLHRTVHISLFGESFASDHCSACL